MKTLRIAQAALATILAVGINSTTYAFMAVDQPSQVQMDLTQMVDSLRDEIDAGTTNCEDMLAKLDAVLQDIDAKLDEGVANEAEYVAARDAVAQMRYDLKCLANKLTHEVLDANGMPLAHEHLMTDGTYVPGNTGQYTDGGSFANGGGGSMGGGGFSTGGTGTGGGDLDLVGVIGGTIAAVASDDDFPGFIASPSGTGAVIVGN